ncbi:uncharacterized protein HMPREF1541_03162 [Cyphellophora europaea CBS 101466]|uniref:ABC transporter domain-containing protein n=1 Tax=Cyphellophora europaea (strain CBS 101466) TaxID=1220924 RepID=W2RXQ2_CYPE1|nr:uncharacterized protein HMPREF1541_03162 [Cyphellophora europaea CBS 101466]ETN41227.1 hypothetical protein HMPREF1541_03162 [Cyphellophora europaea CBS 101466]
MDEKSAEREILQSGTNGLNGRMSSEVTRAVKGNDFEADDERPLVDIKIRDLLVKVQPPRQPFWRAKVSKDVEAQKAPKVILDNVSLDLPGASLTAIMGSSGSGKTSLLNAASKRVKGKVLKQTGNIACQKNAAALATSNTSLDAGVSYVMQQDALQASLTVRETLQYAADLRLAPKMSRAERRAKVEDVIVDLGLADCADTKIGNNAQRGCSGGEKRRTSIGIQLLADQPVLFADEPTTGLDSTSAMGVVRCLKRLADKGQTVVMTVHQPRSEIWGIIDNIVLLARGAVVYSGPRTSCVQYFERQGHQLPSFVNPFDFIIDVASIDVRSEEAERGSTARVAALHDAWRDTSAKTLQPLSEHTGSLTPFDANAESTGKAIIYWSQRMYVHTHRNWVTTVRDRLGLLAAIVEAVGMGVASGWIYYGLGSDLTGIRSRQGAFFACVSLQPYLIMLFETYRLTIDITVFDRELAEGVTSAFTFITSRRLARLLLEDVPVPFIFSTIFYFMAGFRTDAAQYFTFFGLTLLLHLLSVMVAMFCVAANRHFMIASIIANAMFTIQSFGSGFVVNTRNLAVWLRWLKWITYSYYGYAAFSANEFAGHFYDCPFPGGEEDPQCAEYTGDYILKALNLPNDWLAVPTAALIGFLALMFVVDGLILHFMTHDIKPVRVNVEDSSLGEVGAIEYTPNAVRPITVDLDAFELSVTSKHLFQKEVTKTILHPTTTTFQAGVLNVIMGPSGSGKSSLLNAIANRLRTSTTTNYARNGRVLLNRALPSSEVLKSVICYVPQDDVGLLPALTVRETLRYAARLRLPAWMPHGEKIRRAEDVLLKLGLKDCADTLVGNEMMKGISGGEKRRVTIALQILTEPRILLLDEPTSGLDAFTAASIIAVLKGLASEGRTVIFTIHQPRSDLYKQFGTMLLLAKGGHVVYSGQASDMVSYFHDLGYKCPENANPADFTLDLVSTNWDERSSVSNEKLKTLVDKWTTLQEQHVAPDREIENPAALGSLARKKTPFRIAFPILVVRAFTNVRRQPNILWGRISQFTAFGVIMACFYSPIPNDYYSVQTRAGFANQFGSIFFMGMLNSIATYPPERDIFYHEDDDGIYPLEAFFFQFTAFETPMEITGCLLFSILAVFPTGLHRTAELVFLSAYCGFAVASCGESIGIMFFSLFSHLGLAINLSTLVMALSVPLGGVLAVNVTGFLQWINHVNPVKWQVNAMASEQLRGVTFTCEESQRLSNGACPIETGEQVLALYKLDQFSTGEAAGYLAIIVVAIRVLAYAVLKLRRTNFRRK